MNWKPSCLQVISTVTSFSLIEINVLHIEELGVIIKAEMENNSHLKQFPKRVSKGSLLLFKVLKFLFKNGDMALIQIVSWIVKAELVWASDQSVEFEDSCTDLVVLHLLLVNIPLYLRI